MNEQQIIQLLDDVAGVNAALQSTEVTTAKDRKRLPHVQELIEKGGQGAVYRGRVEDEEAAVKVYFPGQVALRIEREVQALTNLRCPSIVKLLWHGTTVVGGAALPVVATEFINGRSLHDRLIEGPLADDLVRELILHSSSAISSMWADRIVHRDLKPQNIMLREEGGFCVIDLGVARHLSAATITSSGLTWGTMGYMSPEQTKAIKQLTCKSDLFSLGVIAWEALTGRHPTGRDQRRLATAGTREQLLEQQLADHPLKPLIGELLREKPFARPSPEQVMKAVSGSN